MQFKKNLYFIKVLIPGLIVSQMFAFMQVHISNIALYKKLIIVHNSGYIPIPNQKTIPLLLQFDKAFLGGLFFTFSIGIGLSIISLLALLIWNNIFHRSKYLLLILILTWFFGVTLINLNGFCFITTSYLIAIPIVIYLGFIRNIFDQTRLKIYYSHIFSFLIAMILIILLITNQNQNFFINFRDNFLLSNSIGIKLNDFYYRYNLYPAESFKSLSQKQIKTCSINGLNNDPLLKNMEIKLLDNDYLIINDNKDTDLEINYHDNSLILSHSKKTILRAPINDFLKNPAFYLNKFSIKNDKHIFFRMLTFISILISLPIFSYTFLYLLVNTISNFFFRKNLRIVLVPLICFLIIIILIIKINHPKKLQVDTLAKNPDHFNIAQRYWFVNSLGDNPDKGSYKDLIFFLDDPNINVVCMALNSLGRANYQQAIPDIFLKMNQSDHWYVQWYAYKALRTLGWKQKGLK